MSTTEKTPAMMFSELGINMTEAEIVRDRLMQRRDPYGPRVRVRAWVRGGVGSGLRCGAAGVLFHNDPGLDYCDRVVFKDTLPHLLENEVENDPDIIEKMKARAEDKMRARVLADLGKGDDGITPESVSGGFSSWPDAAKNYIFQKGLTVAWEGLFLDVEGRTVKPILKLEVLEEVEPLQPRAQRMLKEQGDSQANAIVEALTRTGMLKADGESETAALKAELGELREMVRLLTAKKKSDG